MNRDDIIRMAQEASGVNFPVAAEGVKIAMSIAHIECFANLVAAAEREACAQECFKLWDKWVDSDRNLVDCPDAEDCGLSIRARGQE